MSILSWDNATNRARAELLFENRNKEYGAYQIRRNYEKSLFAAFLNTLGAISLPFVIMFVINHFSTIKVKPKLLRDDTTVFIDPPILVKPELVTPIIIPPSHPVAPSIRFTVPLVVKLNETQDPPPTPEGMEGASIGTVTHTDNAVKTDDPPTEIATIAVEDEKPRMWVQEMPEFPGGEQKFIEFLAKNFHYPAAARENGINGMLYIYFVVGKDGKVKDAQIKKGVGWGCDEEALRVVNSSPQWKPGRQNGSYVPVQFNVPMRLDLKQ